MRIYKHLSKMSINQRLLTLPVIFMIGATAMMLISNYQRANHNKYTAGINLAGQQRMLIQKHTVQVFMEHERDKTDMAHTRQLLKESISLLRFGGRHRFGMIDKAEAMGLMQSLDEQEFALQNLFKVADAFLNTDEFDEKTFAQKRANLLAAVDATHRTAQQTVDVISSLSNLDSKSDQQSSNLIGLFVMIVSSGWALFCGRSVSMQVRQSAKRLRTISSNDLTDVSQALIRTADRTSHQAASASGAADQLRANSDSLATAVGQFDLSIKEISCNATNAATISTTAVDVVDQTNVTIARLGQSGREIGNVIKVINSIAEQTNLLALNAAIEAARAGGSGKGFAVVANEVKELAQQTRDATNEIIRTIEKIRDDTKLAVDAIGNASSIISEINNSQHAIAAAVEEQSITTSDIARTVAEVAVCSSEIANSIASVAEAAAYAADSSNETMTAAGTVDDLATELLQLIGESSVGRARVVKSVEPPSKKGKYRLELETG